MKALRSCMVAACPNEPSAGQYLCRPHWDALPGRTRSRLAMSVAVNRRSARAIDAFQRAAASLPPGRPLEVSHGR